MVCEKCGKEFFEDWRKYPKGEARFCSRNCSNSRKHSKEVKDKIRNSINEFNEKNGTKRDTKYCKKCNKKLSYNNKSGFCSFCKFEAIEVKNKYCNRCNKKLSYNNKSGFCLNCIAKNKRDKYRYCEKCGSTLQHNNKIGICTNCNHRLSIVSESVKKWKKKRKEILVDYKGGKCEICGYNRCLSALEFHHLNEEEKSFSISSKNIVSIDRYKEEVDKCILVCANCHREIHADMISL